MSNREWAIEPDDDDSWRPIMVEVTAAITSNEVRSFAFVADPAIGETLDDVNNALIALMRSNTSFAIPAAEGEPTRGAIIDSDTIRQILVRYGL